MAKDHKQLVYYLDHLLPRQLAVKHTNSSSAKGASATLLVGDCMVMMDCVIQFSVT